MKLLFMTQNEAPFRMRWLDELAKYIDVTVLHVGEYDKAINMNYIDYHSQRCICIQAVKTIGKLRLFAMKRFQYEQYDLLMLDGYGFLAQQILIIYLKLHKLNYLMSIDGGFVNNSENRIKLLLKKFFMHGAEAYFSTGKYTDNYIRHYAGVGVKIIRHKFSSVELNQIYPLISEDERKSLRKQLRMENIFTIIAVGQFISRKGFDILLDAFNMLDDKCQIIFAGSSNKEAYKTKLFSVIAKRVHFVGFCDRQKLDEYYRAADVFVLPTRYDTWGLVIGEAMATGLPVITTDMCIAGKTMIEDGKNGFIIPIENAPILANRINELKNNPELCRKMANENLKLITQYAIENAAKEDFENLKRLDNVNK